jgi:hypothetical protein
VFFLNVCSLGGSQGVNLPTSIFFLKLEPKPSKKTGLHDQADERKADLQNNCMPVMLAGTCYRYRNMATLNEI